MRTVLVCVRTPLAAQSIVACATRLGVGAVRTATSEAEAMARLVEQPAELILADTAVGRPDPAGFARRLLARAPRALLLLFGNEEPHVVTASLAAGARGLIRSADQDPVAAVVKALLLIGTPRRSAVPAGSERDAAAGGLTRAGGLPGAPASGPPAGFPPDPAHGARPEGARGEGAWPDGSGVPPRTVPAQRGDAAEPAAVPARRLTLTERELQVLRGMADGKSNAEIGRDLYVSEDTVKTHARRLFRKLGVRDRAHAVAVGFRSGALG